MDSKSPRPRQFWDDHASLFKNRSLAEAYKLRPPYPDEMYEILVGLLGNENARVLDVGCGPGKIARALIDRVGHVDAVDFSLEMVCEWGSRSLTAITQISGGFTGALKGWV